MTKIAVKQSNSSHAEADLERDVGKWIKLPPETDERFSKEILNIMLPENQMEEEPKRANSKHV